MHFQSIIIPPPPHPHLPALPPPHSINSYNLHHLHYLNNIIIISYNHFPPLHLVHFNIIPNSHNLLNHYYNFNYNFSFLLLVNNYHCNLISFDINFHTLHHHLPLLKIVFARVFFFY